MWPPVGRAGKARSSPFEREAGTGALTQLPGEAGCISSSNELCAGAAAINGPEDLVVSPDGKNIYANSHDDDAVIELDRNPETGALKELGCLASSLTAETETCTQVKSIGGPLGVAISPGGQNVYVSELQRKRCRGVRTQLRKRGPWRSWQNRTAA